MSKEKKKKPGEVTRRQFIAGTGVVVGGAAIGTTALLAACGGDGGTTKTTTVTATETVSKFVCPSCSQEFASLAVLQSHSEAEHPGEELTELIINGQTYRYQIDPNWTLGEVLREKMGLTGVKIPCDSGACGACTVLLDGKPILSCLKLAVECEGKGIETIEGLSTGFELHPIQTAFWDNDGLQCGMCTPGIIMAVKALLDRNPDPTEADVRKGLGGHLCVCGAYPSIIASTLEAAKAI